MELSGAQSDLKHQRANRFFSPIIQGALLMGVVVHLAGFLIFKVDSNPLPRRADTAAFIEYVSARSLAGDAALEEQAQLLDSAPLFVPTQWNAAQQIPLVPYDRVRERFPEFEPEIDLLDALQPSRLAVAQSEGVGAPIDLLASRYWAFFNGFGESGIVESRYPNTGAVAQISVLGSTTVESSLSLEAGLGFFETLPIREPVVFYFRVSGSGVVVGEPVLAESSGNEAFDAAAREWLLDPGTLGQLPSGYLSVKVYP